MAGRLRYHHAMPHLNRIGVPLALVAVFVALVLPAAAQARKRSARRSSPSAAKTTKPIAIEPQPVRQGGVLFVLIRSKAAPGQISCTFAGRPVPIHPYLEGTRVMIGIAARHPTGEFPLIVSLPGAGGAMQETRKTVTVAAARFGPAETLALPPEKAALLSSPHVVPDAQALHDVLIKESPEQLWSGQFTPPTPDGKSFGVDRVYANGADGGENLDATEGNYHKTLDYPFAPDTPVRPVNAGIVVFKQDLVLGGTTIVVDHGQGVMSAYFHLASSTIAPGDPVTRRTVIGKSGDTGLAAAPLLRLALYVHGVPVDPRVFEAIPKDQQGIGQDEPGPRKKTTAKRRKRNR